MSKRARYQFGCLTRRKRVRGGDVWRFRYYETNIDGGRYRRSCLIGTVTQYPTRADVLRVIERFRVCASILNIALQGRSHSTPWWITM